MLTEIVERVSGETYHDFVTERQIRFLGLKRTGFAEDLENFRHEDVSLTENIHQLFKKDGKHIDPTEPAASYDIAGRKTERAASSALRVWGISGHPRRIYLSGISGWRRVLIHKPEHRKLVYALWNLPDGREVPGMAGWQFYKHRGLMDIKGSVPGYSSS
ncbi:MAG: hypothetical protein ACLRMZ_00805 [Blautia marasmi]